MESIITTIITAVVTLIGIIVTAKTTQNKITQEMQTQNAIQQNEIDHLKSEMKEMRALVKEHNDYAKHIPAIEESIKYINKMINRR